MKSLRGVVVASEKEALALAAKVDASLGLPRCNCPECGGPPWDAGLHQPCSCTPGASVDVACVHVTRTHALPLESVDGKAWALPLDEGVGAKLGLARSEIDRREWLDSKERGAKKKKRGDLSTTADARARLGGKQS